MALPIVAIIGRPNVGKSMLVNRFSGQRQSIVFDQPGVTRDRTYQLSFWKDREFLVVDTGGLIFDDDTEFLPYIREQAMTAMAEASAVVFVVDGKEGPTEGDHEIASWMRSQNLPIILAVNKCESQEDGLIQAAQFWELGLGEPYAVSAIHGSGTGDMLDALVEHLPETSEIDVQEEVKVAIVGRPNVGKSSMLNAFVGEKRAIVSPISGTTRDSIDMIVTRGEGENQVRYRLIDTAGIRKKKNVDFGPEFFGINRAFKAIKRADVVLLVIDALDGVTEQDQKLAGRIEEEGRACIIVVNKWDAIDKDSHTIYEFDKTIEAKIHFLGWATRLYVSALTGKRLPNILDAVDQAVEEHRRRVTTSVVNEVLEDAVGWHTPPTTRQGRQGRIYYGTQVRSQPPSFALFVNDPKLFGESYRRYIEKQFRKNLGYDGTPIRLMWRGKSMRDLERSKGANRATKVGRAN
ncbi:MAG: ribosome biogenesis GTPase Der [Leptolyngbya foveolarum]|uniref:GTPase Der n=1 Tax=Leptolyngbya foveolarum TaxID=47253 RepID=A0A2W4U6H1_9CYAN|nr:MAG: ribosome biogenesis GTPase Der [Leptolyngbya foveolarum]